MIVSPCVRLMCACLCEFIYVLKLHMHTLTLSQRLTCDYFVVCSLFPTHTKNCITNSKAFPFQSHRVRIVRHKDARNIYITIYQSVVLVGCSVDGWYCVISNILSSFSPTIAHTHTDERASARTHADTILIIIVIITINSVIQHHHSVEASQAYYMSAI